MSTSGLESIDRTAKLTHIWINDLDVRLGWHNKQRSYRLLRALLQALRDWLPINEAAHLGAQLPELLRGAYYEHWRPTTTPAKPHHRADFVARIERSFEADPPRSTVDEITTVLGLLSEKLEAGEIKNVQHALPPVPGRLRLLRWVVIWSPPRRLTFTRRPSSSVPIPDTHKPDGRRFA